MPSILTHPAVPLGIALALGSRAIPPRLLAAGVAASIVPDLDVIGLRLGVAYHDALGHRGFSHSIAFALSMGVVAAMVANTLHTSPRIAAMFVFASTVSHPLLDMFTDRGGGVALLWPLTQTRWRADWRPIEVSPLEWQHFVDAAGRVLASELLWVWLPVMAVALIAWGLRAARNRR